MYKVHGGNAFLPSKCVRACEHANCMCVRRLPQPTTSIPFPVLVGAAGDVSLYERGEVDKRRQRLSATEQRSELKKCLPQSEDKKDCGQVSSLTVGGSLSYECMRVLDYFGHDRTLQKGSLLFFKE